MTSFEMCYTLGHILQSFWAIFFPAILKGCRWRYGVGMRWLKLKPNWNYLKLELIPVDVKGTFCILPSLIAKQPEVVLKIHVIVAIDTEPIERSTAETTGAIILMACYQSDEMYAIFHIHHILVLRVFQLYCVCQGCWRRCTSSTPWMRLAARLAQPSVLQWPPS